MLDNPVSGRVPILRGTIHLPLQQVFHEFDHRMQITACVCLLIF